MKGPDIKLESTSEHFDVSLKESEFSLNLTTFYLDVVREIGSEIVHKSAYLGYCCKSASLRHTALSGCLDIARIA